MNILRDYKNIPLMKLVKKHLEDGIPFSKPLIRVGSAEWSNFVDEVKRLEEYGFIELDAEESELINSSIGEEAIYEGSGVKLEVPYLVFSDSKTKTNLFEVYVNDGGKIIKVNFTDVNCEDHEQDKLVNEMLFIKENYHQINDNNLIFETVYDHANEIRKTLKENINEGFLADRVKKFRDIPKIKSKTKLMNLYKDYHELKGDELNDDDKRFLSDFKIERLILKQLLNHELTDSDKELLKLYSENNKNYQSMLSYMEHPLKDYLDWEDESEENNIMSGEADGVSGEEIKISYLKPRNAFPYYLK